MTDQVRNAKRYHRLKQRLFFAQLFLNILLLAVFFLSGWSVALKGWAASLTPNFFMMNALYLSVVGVALFFLVLPLDFLEGFAWEHRFSLSNQKFLAWLKDRVKTGFLNAVVFLIAIEALYLCVRYFRGLWWVWTAVFWLLLSLVVARLVPSVLIPLFYKYSKLSDQGLRERLLRLFQRCGLAIKDAYQIDFSTKTKKANAMICGIGNNRRVILTDNLVNGFTPEEIEAVVGHEIGHYKNHDIVRLAAANAVLTFFSFFVMDVLLRQALARLGFARLDDIAFFPIFGLYFIVLSFVLGPLMNAYSRFLETRADIFSLKLMGRPQDLISAFQKLGEMNLAEFEPSAVTEILFYSHPPLAKRMRLAENFFKENT